MEVSESTTAVEGRTSQRDLSLNAQEEWCCSGGGDKCRMCSAKKTKLVVQKK